MKIAVLVLLLASALSAATILPGSWIDVYDTNQGAFSIQADDGFFITGEFDEVNGPIGVGPDGVGSGQFLTSNLDIFVISVSAPWLPGPGFGAEGDSAIQLEIPKYTFSPGDVSAPFTFFGRLNSNADERYEFTGQGTAYLTPDPLRGNHYDHRARYEFEAVAAVPEPSTWALLLLGLCAVNRIGKRQHASIGAPAKSTRHGEKP